MRKILAILFSFCSGFVVAQVAPVAKEKIPDSVKIGVLDEVVISASRVMEKLLQSPVSIQKVNEKYFRSAPAPGFFDALENVQGVQMITPSLGFKVINARGFANTTNVRFAQLVDGMDVQSPHIGGPIGNALGPTDLDIENVEIIPGVASALYGMNTINGLADFATKNPFTSEGIMVQQKTGITHLGDSNSSAKIFSETSLRIAKIVSPKFAFKINGSFSKGYDWIADDHSDLNPNANISTNLTGYDNPARDLVNGYGNESSDRKTITLQGKSYVVSRTGYYEKQVVDYSLQNIKADVGLYYKLSAKSSIVYLFHMALLDNVYQRANRFRLQNYFIQQHGIQFQSPSVHAKVYFNNENTGKSYNLRSMAENIDRDYKPDNTWYADYTTAFNNATTAGKTAADAHREARAAADAGRFQPGTDAFKNSMDKLKNTNNWDYGAALRVKASFVQAEAQVNLTEEWLSGLKKNAGLEILTGIDSRTYIIVPDGNYFINPEKGKTYSNIVYGKTGGFASLTKTFFHNTLKFGATLRADKNDYFPLAWNPRFTCVYSPTYKHNFRLSFQSGYRYPSIFEAYSNINSGGVKRVGGLPVMSNGIFENAWLATSISAFQAAVLKDINQNGLTKNNAIIKNQGVLKKNPYTYIKPEHIQSFEAGYKGLFFDGKLFVDADFYFNNYHSFIAQANMNVPNTQQADSIPFYLYDKTKQNQYRMWTNSQTSVYNYGFTFGLTYHFAKGYNVNANTSYAKLQKSSNEDGLEDGFNTPQWITNIGIYNENIYKNIGAGLSFKWQDAYYWQSFLVNGNTPAYSSVDAQISYTITRVKLKIKLGATNLLNHYYRSFLGGPEIGGLYYTTLTYGIK
ncbi:MAG: TonB-dependent receptor [Bacteroidetes bacterium]|nr:TonB-dependent receptor [Bacteroidota bacterium]